MGNINLRCSTLIMAFVILPLTASAVTIDIVGGVTANPGTTVEVPIAVNIGGNESVAATQNGIVFDASRLQAGVCRINPDIGSGSLADKELNKSVKGNVINAMVFTTRNTNPLPSGSYILYTCTFAVRSDAPSGEAMLQQGPTLIASDPSGKRLGVSGSSSSIVVVGGSAAGADVGGLNVQPAPQMGGGGPAPGGGGANPPPLGTGSGAAPAAQAPAQAAPVGGAPRQPAAAVESGSEEGAGAAVAPADGTPVTTRTVATPAHTVTPGTPKPTAKATPSPNKTETKVTATPGKHKATATPKKDDD